MTETIPEMLAADLAATMFSIEEVAVAITYTPGGGSPVPIKAQLGAIEKVREGADRNELSIWRRRVGIAATAENGIAAPAVDDTMAEADGTEWTVVRVATLVVGVYAVLDVISDQLSRTAKDDRLRRVE